MFLKLLIAAVSLYFLLQCYLVFLKIKQLNKGGYVPDNALVRSHRLLEEKYEILSMSKGSEQYELNQRWKGAMRRHIEYSKDLTQNDSVNAAGLKVVINND